MRNQVGARRGVVLLLVAPVGPKALYVIYHTHRTCSVTVGLQSSYSAVEWRACFDVLGPGSIARQLCFTSCEPCKQASSPFPAGAQPSLLVSYIPIPRT